MKGKDVIHVTSMTHEELLEELARDAGYSEEQIHRLRQRLFWWKLASPVLVLALVLGLVLYTHEEEYQHTHPQHTQPEVEIGPIHQSTPQPQRKTQPAWFDYRIYES